MKQDIYEARRLDSTSYQFFSEGPKGKIELRIIFTFERNQYCNLCFGIWNYKSGEIDDLVEIRNGDMDRLLATVGQVTIDFLASNPKAYVFATGSSAARTRKYQMGISQNLEYIRERHQILGFIANKFLSQKIIPKSQNSAESGSFSRKGSTTMGF